METTPRPAVLAGLTPPELDISIKDENFRLYWNNRIIRGRVLKENGNDRPPKIVFNWLQKSQGIITA